MGRTMPDKKKPAAPKLTVTKIEDVGVEVLANEIVAISEAIIRIFRGSLRRATIVLLVSHASKVSQIDVNRVLDALEDLKTKYVK